MFFFPSISFLPTFPYIENPIDGTREKGGSVVREEMRKWEHSRILSVPGIQ